MGRFTPPFDYFTSVSHSSGLMVSNTYEMYHLQIRSFYLKLALTGAQFVFCWQVLP